MGSTVYMYTKNTKSDSHFDSDILLDINGYCKHFQVGNPLGQYEHSIAPKRKELASLQKDPHAVFSLVRKKIT